MAMKAKKKQATRPTGCQIATRAATPRRRSTTGPRPDSSWMRDGSSTCRAATTSSSRATATCPSRTGPALTGPGQGSPRACNAVTG